MSDKNPIIMFVAGGLSNKIADQDTLMRRALSSAKMDGDPGTLIYLVQHPAQHLPRQEWRTMRVDMKTMRCVIATVSLDDVISTLENGSFCQCQDCGSVLPKNILEEPRDSNDHRVAGHCRSCFGDMVVIRGNGASIVRSFLEK